MTYFKISVEVQQIIIYRYFIYVIYIYIERERERERERQRELYALDILFTMEKWTFVSKASSA